jgi:hypothetical protein
MGWHSFCNKRVKKQHAKEADMLALKQNHTIMTEESSSCSKSLTTLYELVETVAEVTGPGEEGLIGPVVMQLLRDYHAKFECGLGNGPAKTKGGNRHLYLYKGAEA